MVKDELELVPAGATALARREQKVNGLLMTGALTSPFALMLPALDVCFGGPVSLERLAAGGLLWEAGLLLTGSCAAALVGPRRPSWRHKILPPLLALVPGLAAVLPHPQGALIAAAAAALMGAGLLPGRQRGTPG